MKKTQKKEDEAELLAELYLNVVKLKKPATWFIL